MAEATLHLHAGTHKTGTTAIQSVFHENAETIAAQTGTVFIPFLDRTSDT